MAGTWKGIGTKFYGSKDQNPDNSFITTEWFVFFFIPIIPLSSYRVIYRGTTHGLSSSTSHYLILRKISVDWIQVLSTYLIGIVTGTMVVLTGWIVGSVFNEKEWLPIAVVLCSLLPILISGKLFYEAKPSTNPRKRVKPISNESTNPNWPGSNSKDTQYINGSGIEYEISRIPKPNISPPLILSVPDVKSLEPVMVKYESILNKILDERKGLPPTWVKVKLALDDSIFLNYKTISHFMNIEVYENNIDKKRELEDLVKAYTFYAASYAWIVGKEMNERDPKLKQRFNDINSFRVEEIPSDALELLKNAAYLPYYFFAIVFTDYYDSEYGMKVRYQKLGHLVDTYQGIMKGMVACFLDGLKS